MLRDQLGLNPGLVPTIMRINEILKPIKINGMTHLVDLATLIVALRDAKETAFREGDPDDSVEEGEG